MANTPIIPINENFYTFEELKDFTNNFTDRSIINLSTFVETKTKGEYVIVQRKMLSELNMRLFENNIAMFDIQRFLNEMYDKYKDEEHTKALTNDIMRFLNNIWAKVVEKNSTVKDRWKDQLEKFE